MDMDKRIGVRLTHEQWEKLGRLAVAMGRMVTPSEAVRRLIDNARDPGKPSEAKVNEDQSKKKDKARKPRTLGLQNFTSSAKEILNKSST